MIRKTLAGAALALSFAAPAMATDIVTMTEAERTAFRQEVRAYLLDNPEVLMEAIAILEQRQEQAAAANDEQLVQTNAKDIFEDGHSWIGGNPEGDITLVEFSDYRCTYCRKAHPEVEELIKSDGNIRFIVKEFPILGEQSELSSRFAIATLQLAGPEAYKKAHDALITFRGNVTVQSLENLADRLDLDAKEIMARMTSPEVDTVIQENRALAQRLAISGTPTFVLESTMLRGYVPLDGMRQMVKEVRAD
ncbi:DsbA family protein [Actibacterium sp. MT2.3-13A]|uniref:DsbA family protein n=1 Tax=Actibacterium sp. MT2.3-13A TaxID=2828332 RepID=UPI001BAAA329|nr:DsbA family protein [Actibacterium sp. MT2.3-13A]